MSIHNLEVPVRAEIVGESVRVHELEVTSPEAVAGARRYRESTGQPDVAEYISLAIGLGAKAMALGGTTVDVEALNSAVAGLSGDVSRVAGEAAEQIRSAVESATDAESGTVAVAVQRIMDRLAAEVTGLVVGEDAPVRAGVERAVKSVVDKALEEVQRSLAAQTTAVRSALASDDPSSPLGAMRHDVLRTVRDSSRELADQIGELRTVIEVQRATAATMERTAVKGNTYQADVIETLEAISLAAGDQLEVTHDSVGAIAKCKTGDAVISLGEAISRERSIRLAVEVKDMTKSPAAWEEELARARANRSAQGAIGIVKGTEHMPGRCRVRVLDRLNILVAYDPATDDEDMLLAALHLLRVQAACAAVEGSGDDLDVAAVRECVDASLGLLDDFDKVERAGNAAQRGLDDVRKHALKLRQDLLERLARALRLIDAGSEAG